jgi:hypothetical protein
MAEITKAKAPANQRKPTIMASSVSPVNDNSFPGSVILAYWVAAKSITKSQLKRTKRCNSLIKMRS